LLLQEWDGLFVMPRKKKPRPYGREEAKVDLGLDPRSLYPRCDFCAKKDPITNQSVNGNVQLGRWWAHTECAADYSNATLSCVQLPVLDYATVDGKTAWQKLGAMQARINVWIQAKRQVLKELNLIVGDSLQMSEAAPYS